MDIRNPTRARIPRRGRPNVGVEWWLSRMSTHDVRVDFHVDRDEKLALKTGRIVSTAAGPLSSSTARAVCMRNEAMAAGAGGEVMVSMWGRLPLGDRVG